MKDGLQGMAAITQEHSKRIMDYKYTVDQKEYEGKSRSNWEGEYKGVRVGDACVMYFSASHPWLSALYKPRAVVEGLPALIVALLFESFFIATVINPKGKWALNLDNKNSNQATG